LARALMIAMLEHKHHKTYKIAASSLAFFGT